MKTLVYTAVLLVATTAFVNAGDVYYDVRDAPYLFHKFIRDYNRHYKDTEEVLVRYAAFINSLEMINKLNVQNELATYDINKFADYTKEEMERMNGLIDPKRQPRYHVFAL